ncbi:unnamed protein product [Thlaspi arvense]|uniref:Ubiquitin-like protease family profile domain-containing protein n=1 Tax=Thlaspi arvense TaxID=13288 RepID=A0AAU9RYF7_THLAR|nr:unnamed protein product [Thlaspi arvense]
MSVCGFALALQLLVFELVPGLREKLKNPDEFPMLLDHPNDSIPRQWSLSLEVCSLLDVDSQLFEKESWGKWDDERNDSRGRRLGSSPVRRSSHLGSLAARGRSCQSPPGVHISGVVGDEVFTPSWKQNKGSSVECGGRVSPAKVGDMLCVGVEEADDIMAGVLNDIRSLVEVGVSKGGGGQRFENSKEKAVVTFDRPVEEKSQNTAEEANLIERELGFNKVVGNIVEEHCEQRGRVVSDVGEDFSVETIADGEDLGENIMDEDIVVETNADGKDQVDNVLVEDVVVQSKTDGHEEIDTGERRRDLGEDVIGDLMPEGHDEMDSEKVGEKPDPLSEDKGEPVEKVETMGGHEQHEATSAEVGVRHDAVKEDPKKQGNKKRKEPLSEDPHDLAGALKQKKRQPLDTPIRELDADVYKLFEHTHMMAGAVKHVTKPRYAFNNNFLFAYGGPDGVAVVEEVEDTETVYMPMCWADEHWVGLAINLSFGHIEVLELYPPLRTDEEVVWWMSPICVMLPYAVKSLCPQTSQLSGVRPYRWTRVGDIYLNKRSGDCGLVAVKFMELHVAGDPSPHMFGLTDEIMDNFRKQFAMDLYRDLVVPLYCCKV